MACERAAGRTNARPRTLDRYVCCTYIGSMIASDPKTRRFELRLSEAEAAMLDTVAKATGLSAADVLRQCVRERYAEHFGVRRLAQEFGAWLSPSRRLKSRS